MKPPLRLVQWLLGLLFLCSLSARAQQVTITSVAPSPVCAGSPINVTYTYALPEPGTAFLYLNGPSTTNLLIGQASVNGGNGAVVGTIPANRITGSYTVFVRRVSSVYGTVDSPVSTAFTVNAQPTAPTTTNVSYCQNATTSPLTATGQNLRWYVASSGGTGFTSITPATSTPGTTTYYVSQTINGCEGPRAALAVTVNPLPVAPTTTDVSYCQNATTSPLTATGQSLRWYSSSSGGTGFTSITPATSTPGTTTYYVSQTNANGCESARSPLTVTVNALPVAPTTTNVSYCQSATANPLMATASAGGTLNWYGPSNNALGSTAPVPPTSTAGTTFYSVSQTVNGCESARAQVAVTINSAPSAPVTRPVSVCQGTTPFTLVNSVTAAGTLKWYTSPTSTSLAGAPQLQTTSVGSQVFYVSQTNANGCESDRAAITYTVNSYPTPPAVMSPVAYCQNAQAAPLQATASPGGTLNFYTISTGGIPSISLIPSTQASNSYYVSQTVNGCESTTRATITVTINALPPRPAVTTPVVYCQFAIAAPLSATAQTNSTLIWYATNGQPLGSTPPTPPTTTAGVTSYSVSQRDPVGCVSDPSIVNVTINAKPTAPATSPLSGCLNAPAPLLAGSVTATGTLKWYTASSGGAGTTVAPVAPTATPGTFIYYVSQTVNGCESDRATLTYTVNPLPSPPVPTPRTVFYCQGAAATPLTASGQNLKWYLTNTTSVSTPSITPSTTVAGTVNYYVSQTSANGCESARDSVTVSTGSRPVAPTVVSPVAYCQNAVATPLTVTALPGNALRWYTTSTGGTGTTTAPTLTTTTPGTFTYYVSQASAEGCESDRSAITVTITPTPSAPLVSQTPIIYCQGAVASPLTATATVPNGILNWYTQAIGGTPSPVYPTPSTAESEPPTRYYYVSQSINGCEGPRSTIAVTIRPAVPVSIVGLPGRLGQCAAPITLVGSPAGGSFTIDGTPATQLVPGSLATGSHSIVYQYVSAGGCTATATGSVIIDPLPVATLVNSGPLSCTNGVVTLAAGEDGFGVSFRFSAGATQLATRSLATVQTAGVYSVTVIAPSGCSAVAQTTVTSETALAAPGLQASALSTDNQPISVTASGCSGVIDWLVQGGNGQASGAIYTVSQPGNYTLSARCIVGSCISPYATPVSVSIRSGTFAITGVTTQQCQLVDATRGQFQVTFIPQYSGLNGSPVSLAVVNETPATSAPAPYTVRLFTDNPVVTLAATQVGSAEARYTYNWRAACIGNVIPNRPPVAMPVPTQPLTQYQPYQLVLTSYFADPDGQSLTFSASGLPAGILLVGSRLGGSPAGVGSVSAVVTATDPNGLQASTSIVFIISPSVQPPTTPPTAGFTITGVTNLTCVSVSSSERRISFSPVYSGLTGQSVSFRVVNESAATTAPGPYSVQLYTDNPTIRLEAVQAGVTASYRYDWLSGCTSQPTVPPVVANRPPVVLLPLTSQTATVGQGYSLTIPPGTFSDPDGDALSVRADGLPAGLGFSSGLNVVTGTPVEAGVSTILLTATDPGGLSVSTRFVLTVVSTPPVPPTTGFAITGVNTVRCETISAGERRLTFTPIYAATNGRAISLAVVNELAATTAPGPYSIRLYTDNPVVTLRAEQDGQVSAYRYEWLKGCTANSRQGVPEATSQLQVTVLGNPVAGESVEVDIRGVAGQPVQVQVVDLLGYPVSQQHIQQAGATERLSLPLGRSQGVLLLHVSTPDQRQQIKLLRP